MQDPNYPGITIFPADPLPVFPDPLPEAEMVTEEIHIDVAFKVTYPKGVVTSKGTEVTLVEIREGLVEIGLSFCHTQAWADQVEGMSKDYLDPRIKIEWSDIDYAMAQNPNLAKDA